MIMDKEKIKQEAMKYGKIAATAVAMAALKALADKKTQINIYGVRTISCPIKSISFKLDLIIW